MSNLTQASPQMLKRDLAAIAGAGLIGFGNGKTLNDLAIGTAGKGAGLIGYNGRTIENRLDEGYFSITEFGGKPNDPTFDNAIAFNNFLNSTSQKLFFPDGQWTFKTKPQNITRSVKIMGYDLGATMLIRDYTELISNNGLITAAAGSLKLERLGIIAAAGTTGGSGVSLVATLGGSPDFSYLEELYISGYGGTGTWLNALNVDGLARTAAPIGVRDLNTKGCHLFASTNAACRLSGTVAANIIGGGMFPAGGTTGRLQITGNSTVKSFYPNIDIGYLGGLYVDNTIYANIKASVIGGNINNASSADTILVSGHATGTVDNFWINSSYFDPSDFLNATNGFQGLPGGAKFQWFNASVGTTWTNINYPVPFPNNIFAIIVSPSSGNTGATVVQDFGSRTTSFCRLVSNMIGTTANIIAIGN